MKRKLPGARPILARAACAAAVIGSAVVVGAWSDGSASAHSNSIRTLAAKPYTPPKKGCGSFSAPEPPDPTGAIAALPAAQRAALAGYTNFPKSGSAIAVLKSAWSSWKPTHKGPYSVAISWGQAVSPFQVETLADLQSDLKGDPQIANVTAESTGNNLNIPEQIQQYEALVAQKPDLIILESPGSAAFVGEVAQAAAAGIPTVTLVSPVPSKYAVNVDANIYIASADMASFLAHQLKGKGNLLLMRAIQGTTLDSQAYYAWESVLKHCPGLDVLGTAYGEFNDQAAQGTTLGFLSAHPQPIAGVLETATMAPGVMRAFQQDGRPTPIVPDSGLEDASLGYWYTNRSTYKDEGTTLPPVPAAAGTAEVALRMLEGQGVKINTIVGKQPIVTNANLSKWAQPGWTLDTQGAASGTRSSALTSSFLAGFFKKPAAVK
jgi:ribose transport system substrate-binding protein